VFDSRPATAGVSARGRCGSDCGDGSGFSLGCEIPDGAPSASDPALDIFWLDFGRFIASNPLLGRFYRKLRAGRLLFWRKWPESLHFYGKSDTLLEVRLGGIAEYGVNRKDG